MMRIRGIAKSAALLESVAAKVLNPQVNGLHTDCALRADQRSEHVGNPWRFPHLVGKDSVPMWKVHWLYLMKRKAELEGEPEPTPRAGQLNWDYNAELSAFAHRLKIQVHADVIKRVFTEPVQTGSRDNDERAFAELAETGSGENNDQLVVTGLRFSTRFLQLYVSEAFPDIGLKCGDSLVEYLLSEKLLSYVAGNLGYGDLIQSAETDVDSRMLRRCFLASVAAVLSGPGGRLETARFLNDFVVTDLINKDIVHDIWRPADPMKELVGELHMRGVPAPEVRLTRRAGLNSVQPVFFVGLYCDGKLLAESAGESVIKAEADAAKVALKHLYRVDVARYVPALDLCDDPGFLDKVERLPVSEPADSLGRDFVSASLSQ